MVAHGLLIPRRTLTMKLLQAGVSAFAIAFATAFASYGASRATARQELRLDRLERQSSHKATPRLAGASAVAKAGGRRKEKGISTVACASPGSRAR